MKSIRLSLILLLIPITMNIQTQESSNSASLEFAFGGGFKQYNSITYTQINNFQYTQNIGIITGPLFPVSFVYFPNDSFGIGFHYQFGISLATFPNSPIEPFNLNLDYYLGFVNKIRLSKSNRYFLLEYGTLFTHRVQYHSQWKNNISMFYIGPSLLTGYEGRSKNNLFLYTFGGIFDASFYIADHHLRISNRYLNVQFNVGIEFRWRYCYYKTLQQYK